MLHLHAFGVLLLIAHASGAGIRLVEDGPIVQLHLLAAIAPLGRPDEPVLASPLLLAPLLLLQDLPIVPATGSAVDAVQRVDAVRVRLDVVVVVVALLPVLISHSLVFLVAFVVFVDYYFRHIRIWFDVNVRLAARLLLARAT